ncbi:MAG: hypothetical protein V7788_17145, partial [Alphaproteobacteria bacterium]
RQRSSGLFMGQLGSFGLDLFLSWPDLFRPSTSLCPVRSLSVPMDVDARNKCGHDGGVIRRHTALSPILVMRGLDPRISLVSVLRCPGQARA